MGKWYIRHVIGTPGLKLPICKAMEVNKKENIFYFSFGRFVPPYGEKEKWSAIIIDSEFHKILLSPDEKRKIK